MGALMLVDSEESKFEDTRSNLSPLPSLYRKIEQGDNLVIYGRARSGKSTFLQNTFPNRRVQFHSPTLEDEPFIWETNEDMSGMASRFDSGRFTKNVHIIHHNHSHIVFFANENCMLVRRNSQQ